MTLLKKDTYLLLQIDDTLDQLQGVTISFFIDLTKSF